MLNSKNYKIQFFSLFHWCVFWFCPQNLQNFEDVPIKCSEQFLHYIELICRRSCEKKFKSEFHFFSSFSGLQNLDVFLENLLQSKLWNHFQAKIILWSFLFLDFLIVFCMVWKNQKSEPPLVGFWGNSHSKMQEISAKKYFLHFWATIMDLLIALTY